tara:strand:- start:399 stop:866 length:468 start_codon:yes stop_codon:yes gene_type:complete
MEDCRSNIDLFIPIKLISVKNNKVCYRKNRISLNKKAKDFKTELKEKLKSTRNYFNFGVTRPIVLGLHFVRPDLRRRDWVNTVQGIMDCMVEAGIIEEDNEIVILPIPYLKHEKYYTYDKNNSGAYFKNFTSSKRTVQGLYKGQSLGTAYVRINA